MTFRLINARPSPFGRKIEIALIEKGLDYRVRYDVPWGAQTCTPDYSPLQQVPIIIAEDGEIVYDSVYILEWLEGRFPEPSLLPADVEGRLEAKKRQMLGERLMEVAQSLIFEKHRPDPSTSWIERQARKIVGVFAELERIYAGRPLTKTTPLDLGDIAVGTTLPVFEFGLASGLIPATDELCWRGRFPALTLAVDILEERPSFVRTRPEMMDVDLQATVA